MKGWNPQKATKQGRNDTTIPLLIVIPISFVDRYSPNEHHTEKKQLYIKIPKIIKCNIQMEPFEQLITAQSPGSRDSSSP